MMKNGVSRFLIASLILPVIIAGCGTEKMPEEKVLRPVRFQPAGYSDGSRVRVFSGTAKSALESNLSFKVSGTISGLSVKLGDMVEKNQQIATLDNKDYLLTVQEAKAGLQQAKAQALNAASNYARIRRLYEKDNVSKSDLDNSRAAFDSASAFVKSIETKLELAKSRLGYTIISAPFSGAVTAVHVEENENIAPGHPIVSIASETKPEVSVAIPGILISKIREEMPVTVRFDAIPQKKFNGVISEVGVATGRFATTYPVTISLDAGGEFIRPGMAAHVRFVFAKPGKSAIIVPSHAVGEDNSGRFVFILIPENEKTGSVRKIAVKTGELVSEGLEVIEGLSKDDLIVTAGISKLKTGMKVRLMTNGRKKEK